MFAVAFVHIYAYYFLSLEANDASVHLGGSGLYTILPISCTSRVGLGI